MGRLVVSLAGSLDGYVNDADGGFGWAEPDEEVHAFANEQERGFGTAYYGRRLYEVMKVWDDAAWLEGEPPVVQAYGEVWQAEEKVVVSATLPEITTARTRLVRRFDPEVVAAEVAALPHDASIGGATLAGAALRAGIVDELRLLLVPAIVGGGTRALPDGVRLDLELLEERRFASGTVHLAYRIRR